MLPRFMEQQIYNAAAAVAHKVNLSSYRSAIASH